MDLIDLKDVSQIKRSKIQSITRLIQKKKKKKNTFEHGFKSEIVQWNRKMKCSRFLWSDCNNIIINLTIIWDTKKLIKIIKLEQLTKKNNILRNLNNF